VKQDHLPAGFGEGQMSGAKGVTIAYTSHGLVWSRIPKLSPSSYLYPGLVVGKGACNYEPSVTVACRLSINPLYTSKARSPTKYSSLCISRYIKAPFPYLCDGLLHIRGLFEVQNVKFRLHVSCGGASFPATTKPRSAMMTILSQTLPQVTMASLQLSF
jgi:hypothetical protein